MFALFVPPNPPNAQQCSCCVLQINVVSGRVESMAMVDLFDGDTTVNWPVPAILGGLTLAVAIIVAVTHCRGRQHAVAVARHVFTRVGALKRPQVISTPSQAAALLSEIWVAIRANFCGVACVMAGHWCGATRGDRSWLARRTISGNLGAVAFSNHKPLSGYVFSLEPRSSGIHTGSSSDMSVVACREIAVFSR